MSSPGEDLLRAGNDGRKVLNLRRRAHRPEVDLYSEAWANLKGVMGKGRRRSSRKVALQEDRALLYRKYPQYRTRRRSTSRIQ